MSHVTCHATHLLHRRQRHGALLLHGRVATLLLPPCFVRIRFLSPHCRVGVVLGLLDLPPPPLVVLLAVLIRLLPPPRRDLGGGEQSKHKVRSVG